MNTKGYLELSDEDYSEFERLVNIYNKYPREKEIVNKFFKQWRWQQRPPGWLKDGMGVPCIYWQGVAVIKRPNS